MSEFRELPEEQYAKLRVLPMSQFPQFIRDLINEEANQTRPPRKWLIGELTSFVSRGWFEWHFRRSGDPRKKRPKLPSAVRAEVLKRDGLVCGICGGDVAPEDVHLDHIRQRHLGGADVPGNLRVTHSGCNLRRKRREQ